jgi:hypothetical protein
MYAGAGLDIRVFFTFELSNVCNKLLNNHLIKKNVFCLTVGLEKQRFGQTSRLSSRADEFVGRSKSQKTFFRGSVVTL